MVGLGCVPPWNVFRNAGFPTLCINRISLVCVSNDFILGEVIMAIVLAAVLLSVMFIVSPISALKNALGAGGLAAVLAIIGVLLCVPLGYGWFSILTGSGAGDGWYEVSMVALGLASAFLGTLFSLWARSLARHTDEQFQEKLNSLEPGQQTLKQIEPPITRASE